MATNQYNFKVVVYNFRSNRPRKPKFFQTEQQARFYGYSLQNDEKAEYIMYYKFENGEWKQY